MKKEIAAPGVFGPDVLYLMIRAWVMSKAPFPVIEIKAPEVVNALIRAQSGLSFIMSEDIPPVYSGDLYEAFCKYNEDAEKLSSLVECSAAWFAAHLSRIQTKEDIDRFEIHLNAMMTWMHVLEYLALTPDKGYLATQKLLDKELFKYNA